MKRYFDKIGGLFKFFIALILANSIYKHLYKDEIWLICEKETEARDNGYHLFKYIRKEHKEINAYYVIEKNSADIEKIVDLGNVIYFNTIKHYLFFLVSKYSISSQPDGAHPLLIASIEKRIRKRKITIFLQHGITKDELTHHFDANVSYYDLFTTSSTREQKYIIQTYGYTSNTAQLLGLCRFDNLFHSHTTQKIVLVMPTFRKWLVANNREGAATKKEQECFILSEFYQSFAMLLSEPRMLSLLKKNQYRLIFYPHYSIQSYINLFKKFENEYIIIADRLTYDVQQLLINSSILITDFSSVFFDFAYMNKPEIFFQFDEDTYRESHYKDGYFSYRTDGFGPVVTNVDGLINELETIIQRDARVSDEYQERIDSFFDLHDDKNCERTFEAIKKIESKAINAHRMH